MTRALSLLLAICAAGFAAQLHAYSLQPHLARAMLKDMTFDSQGYFSNTTSDAYFMLDQINLEKANACALVFDLNFKQSLPKPILFEFYWQSELQPYSESNKGFFIIQPHQSMSSTYVLRLCDLHKYRGVRGELKPQDNLTGLRIDFPVNRSVSAKFSSMQLVSEQMIAQLPMADAEKLLYLSAFGRVATDSAELNRWLSMAFKSAVVSSFSRLGKDWVFLLVWLLLLGLMSFMLIKPRCR